MRVKVTGDNVSQNVLNMYVKEIVKAHPERKISAVDIIVEGDFLKIRCEYEELDRIA